MFLIAVTTYPAPQKTYRTEKSKLVSVIICKAAPSVPCAAAACSHGTDQEAEAGPEVGLSHHIQIFIPSGIFLAASLHCLKAP